MLQEAHLRLPMACCHDLVAQGHIEGHRGLLLDLREGTDAERASPRVLTVLAEPRASYLLNGTHTPKRGGGDYRVLPKGSVQPLEHGKRCLAGSCTRPALRWPEPACNRERTG